MATLASLVVKIVADATAFRQGLESAQQAVNGFSRSAQKIGRGLTDVGTKLTVGITAPILGVGAAMVKTAADFESQMNVLQVAAGDSGASLDQLRNAAVRVGADTELVGISASEAAEAMTNFYKAGLDTSQIMGDLQGYLAGTSSLGGALRAAIDLAAASELDLAQASDLVVTTMNTFGLSTDEVVAKIGNYVQAADASVASVRDLQQAIINVGPTMASFGFSLEDVNTALAILSTRGIVGAEAGTALKSMFTNIMRDTKDVKKALSELNVSLYDTEGNMKSMPQIVRELSTALDENAMVAISTGGATKEQAKELLGYQKKIQAAQLAIEEYNAGVRGVGQSEKARAQALEQLNNEIAFYQQKHDELLKVLPPTTQQLVKMTQEQRNQYIQTLAGTYGMKALNTLLAEGAEGWDEMAQKIANAATMQETAAARTKGFHAAMEQLRGSVEAFMIQAGTPLIQNVLTPLIQRLTDFIGKLAQADPKFLQIIVTIAGIAAVVGPALVAIGQIITAIGTISGAVSGLVGVFKGLAGAVVPAIGGIIAALGPVLPIVLAVVAVVGLLYLAWKNNWLGIRDVLASVWVKIKEVVQGIINLFSSLGSYFRAVVEDGDYLNDWLTHLPAWLQPVVEWLGQAIAWIAETFSSWENVVNAVSTAWNSIKTIIFNALVSIVEMVTGDHEQAVQIVTNAWSAIHNAVSYAISSMRYALEVWSPYVVSIASFAWNAIFQITQVVWNALKIWLITLLQGLAGFITFILQLIAGDFQGAWTTIQITVVTLVTGMKDSVVALITGMKNMVIGILGSLVKAAFNAGKSLVERFGEGIMSKLEWLYDRVKGMVDWIRDLLPGSDAKEGPLSDLFAAGRALPQTLAQGILAGQGALLNAVNLQAASMARGISMPQARVAGVRGMAPASASNQSISVTINNPRGEPSEASITRQLRNLAYLGVLRPVEA
jgi:TP901 family phage tail tape measure protein